MDKCREAFEQIPEIKKRLFYVSFDEKSQNYHPKRYSLDFGFLRLNFVQGAWLAWQSRQAEVDELKEAMERQGKLAIQAMNEAHKGSRLELSIAKDIQASLKPELIESERQMNAQLTDENMKLEARIDVACKSINSFFDNQVSTPTPREYANFIAEILEVLRGEHE